MAHFNGSGIADEYDERRNSLSSPSGRVDSIDSISRKISNLNCALDGLYQDDQLIIDSYIEAVDNVKTTQTLEANDVELFGYGNLKIDYKLPKEETKRSSTVSTREKQKREVNRFAGIYSMRTVMGNEEPLNINKSKVNHVQKKRNLKESTNSQSTVSKRPLLVELHTFPGFNADELTPLPGSLTTKNILNIVTCAQKDLNRKPGFKKEFKRILFTHPSQAVIQDLFWWFFLDKYQACSQVQHQLFSRVACNYVKLMFTMWEQKYRETFFKRFPSLVCQAIYSTFCHAFPTSYRQFDEPFKQELVDVAYQWIVGTKPVRRCWEKWPLGFLEPQGMNKEDEIQKNVSKKFVVAWFGSESGETTFPMPANAQSEEKVNLTPSRRRSLPKIIENSVVRDGETDATHNDHEEIMIKKDGWLSVAPSENINTDVLDKGEHQLLSNSRLKVASSLQASKINNTSLKRGSKKRESCYAGKGPEFQKVAFDLHGHSPLVRHFLQNKRLAKKSGTCILVQRTEIDKLPPINAPTYQDIIKESLKSSHELEKQIQSLIEQSSNERVAFVRKQKREKEEFKKKETEVLSRQKEVKKISELILLQLSKDKNVENDMLIATSITNALKHNEKESKK